jgi:hypothetical protein
MYDVLLSPGVNATAAKYIYHIISYHISLLEVRTALSRNGPGFPVESDFIKCRGNSLGILNKSIVRGGK